MIVIVVKLSSSPKLHLVRTSRWKFAKVNCFYCELDKNLQCWYFQLNMLNSTHFSKRQCKISAHTKKERKSFVENFFCGMTSLEMQARLNAIWDVHACVCWKNRSFVVHHRQRMRMLLAFICECACMKNCCFVLLLCQRGVFVINCSTRLNLSEGNFHYRLFTFSRGFQVIQIRALSFFKFIITSDLLK